MDPEITFAGYSIGKWVGDDSDGKYNALEVETRFLNPAELRTRESRSTSDGQAIIKERIYLDKADRNTL